MIYKNLCHSCLLVGGRQRYPQFADKDVHDTTVENGQVVSFVREHIRRGLLPTILRRLTAKRNEAKALLKKSAGTPMEKVLDRRQNAIKVTSNSVYGFTGAVDGGQMPCQDIARAVTATGRESIELTAAMVTDPYGTIPLEIDESDEAYAERSATIRKNYPLPRRAEESTEQHQQRLHSLIDVIYGDTDSVMVHFKGLQGQQAQAIELGQRFARWITASFFKPPMTIVFEKIYDPYVLVAKKRYAGLLWTKADKPDKKDVKGMESVRRDNCVLVKRAVDNMINTMLREKDARKMVMELAACVESVARGTVDLADLVISKSLSKAPEDYTPTPPHAQVALKMRARDPHTAPKMGDRVPYIVTAYGGKKAKMSKKAEHPIEVIDKNIPIDQAYYIDNQLRRPCERILEPLLPGITAQIFSKYNATVKLPASVGQFAAVPPPVVVAVKAKGRRKPLPILPGQTTLQGKLLLPPAQPKGAVVELRFEHSIRVSPASTLRGTIGCFTQPIPSCLHCGKSMRKYAGKLDTAPPFCKRCRQLEPNGGVASSKLHLEQQHNEQKTRCDAYWSTCIDCQKVADIEELSVCSVWECPNFFRRTTARNSVEKLRQKLERFDVHKQ